MGLKPKDIALLTAGLLITTGIGYAVYFDYKRHHDPVLKKKLKKEKKKVLKQGKKAEENEKMTTIQLIESILEASSHIPVHTAPEEQQKYFMEQVALGESLCNQGPEHYNEAVLHFYLALRVYPAPMELITIYQKTVPEPVFKLVLNVMVLDQQKRQNEFYIHFPPKDTHTRLAELPAGVNEAGTPIVRRSLVADKDIAEGEIIYSESPIISGLSPSLEGAYCHQCLKHIDGHKVDCPHCDLVAFCSNECYKVADEGYHKYLCINNKKEREADETIDDVSLEFYELCKDKNIKYPFMIAKFLSIMIAEELKKQKAEPTTADKTNFGPWDHVDRFRYLETVPSPQSTKEISMLKQILGPKVQGVSEFLSDEIYCMLKGKLLYNAYGIPAIEDTEVPESDEHMRTVNKDQKYIGAALYKISTYLGQSKDEPNVELSFDHNIVTVRATKDIKKDEELTSSYSLPVPKK